MKQNQGSESQQPTHVPTRTCVGCGAKRAPGDMLRIASKDGAEPEIVVKRRAYGRSAYMCCDRKCLDKVFARRALERSLKLKNSTPQQVKDRIVQAIGSCDAAR